MLFFSEVMLVSNVIFFRRINNISLFLDKLNIYFIYYQIYHYVIDLYKNHIN